MRAKRIDAISISGNIFIEGDIVAITYDLNNVKRDIGMISDINNDWLYLDQSEHFNSSIKRISLNSIAAIVKADSENNE